MAKDVKNFKELKEKYGLKDLVVSIVPYQPDSKWNTVLFYLLGMLITCFLLEYVESVENAENVPPNAQKPLCTKCSKRNSTPLKGMYYIEIWINTFFGFIAVNSGSLANMEMWSYYS